MTKLTLKWRVLILIAAMHGLVLGGSGLVLMLNARTAVEREIRAAQDSAVTLIREGLAQGDESSSSSLETLATTIIQPRHIRIRLVPIDGDGAINVGSGNSTEDRSYEETAPRWFRNWVAADIETEVIQVRNDGVTLGQVEVEAIPDDEAVEVWEDAQALFIVWAVATVVLLGLLAVLIGRALAPLGKLERILERLDAGDFTLRAAAVGSPDLFPIGARIDRLAVNLKNSEIERRGLSQRILGLQDAERKEIARELHDELGPCLFGLTVMADAIRHNPASAAEKVDNIEDIVAQMRLTNARILNALRPPTIGNLPLNDVVTDIVAEFADRFQQVDFNLSVSPLNMDTSEAVDLTVYRILQEGLTNALRHGNATCISIQIRPMDDSSALLIRITDNGDGLQDPWIEGHGLLGMRERVSALQGTLTLGNAEQTGCELEAILTIPMVTTNAPTFA